MNIHAGLGQQCDSVNECSPGGTCKDNKCIIREYKSKNRLFQKFIFPHNYGNGHFVRYNFPNNQDIKSTKQVQCRAAMQTTANVHIYVWKTSHEKMIIRSMIKIYQCIYIDSLRTKRRFSQHM